MNIRSAYQNFLVLSLVLLLGVVSSAQWDGAKYEKLEDAVEKTFGAPRGMIRLDPESRIWADKKNQRIVVDGFIALREGQLEMLACIAATKEHESVVGVFSKAQFVHAGLLAVGAKKGTPVQWDPKYAPPTGSEVKITALWKGPDGKRNAIDVRQWVREVGTPDRILEENFVFAGSSMWKDPDTGEELYMAEDGDLVCVANFSTATLDVPLRSLKSNAQLSFAAFTSRIPEAGTPVRLVLEVVKEAKGSADTEGEASGTASTEDSSQKLTKPKNTLAGYERLIDSPEEVARAEAAEREAKSQTLKR